MYEAKISSLGLLCLKGPDDLATGVQWYPVCKLTPNQIQEWKEISTMIDKAWEKAGAIG
jgi:hypothetical protein